MATTYKAGKNAGEKGKVIAAAVEFTGALNELPTSRSLAGARLVIPILSGHDEASANLGAVFLASPMQKGKACDFAQLANAAGTTVIPIQPKQTPTYSPAQMFNIDVTSAVKPIAAGEAKFHGVVLRIVPDRGIDEGGPSAARSPRPTRPISKSKCSPILPQASNSAQSVSDSQSSHSFESSRTCKICVEPSARINRVLAVYPLFFVTRSIAADVASSFFARPSSSNDPAYRPNRF